MSDKEIEYCPLCGGELGIATKGLTDEYECEDCGTEMYMEVWGYVPKFWHRE